MSTVSHRPSFNPYPLALVAAAFAAGILCARALAVPLAACASVGAVFSLAALADFLRRREGRAAVFLVAAFASAGASLSLAEDAGVGENRLRRLYEEGKIASGDPVELTAALERAPEVAPDGLMLTARAEFVRFKGEGRAASGRVELFAPVRDGRAREGYGALELRRGARLRLLVSLERDERYRNPGVSSFTEFLERRDADARGLLKSHLLVERLDDERVPLPVVWLEAWRESLRARFAADFSRETGGVLSAALLGNRLHLSRATAERFREGGTFHVLVISGLHITFIGGVVWWLVRRVTRRRAWQWGASAACVWAYAVGVGGEPSVVRAALMFTLVALAPAIGRPSRTLNATGGAALALLVWRPRNVLDPSFQLTFISVLSIIGLAWPALARLKEVGAWRPTRSTPYPPACPPRLKAFAESLYWSERGWRAELKRSTHSYRLFKSPLAARLERWRLQTPLRYAFAAVLVSACVQLGLLPLSVVYFHRVSPSALLLNVLVGVLMAVLSLSALAALLASQLSAQLAAPLVWMAEAANGLMTHGVDPFAAAGVASLRVPEYAGAASVVYALYYLPLGALAVALANWAPLSPPDTTDSDGRRRQGRAVRLSAVAFITLLAVILLHPLSAPRPDGRLRVDFLDVGQGDSALVTMPDGTTLLVDGGGRPRPGVARGGEADGGDEVFERDARGVGEVVVSEHLWWRGLDRVDYVLATHADADHIDGLGDVLRNFKTRAAVVARLPSGDPEFARFAEEARGGGVPLYAVARGDLMRFGEVEAEVLWPPPARGGEPSGNEDSIVLRIRFGKRSFLLTGDVEKGAEAALIASTREGLRSDAVKVAHHGSRTSSTQGFVEATSPGLAVISVGHDSPYGHPHREVVARWRARGARVLLTGERGMIRVSTDGEDLRVETFVN